MPTSGTAPGRHSEGDSREPAGEGGKYRQNIYLCRSDHRTKQSITFHGLLAPTRLTGTNIPSPFRRVRGAYVLRAVRLV